MNKLSINILDLKMAVTFLLFNKSFFSESNKACLTVGR